MDQYSITNTKNISSKTIKNLTQDSDEPLLQKNPDRYVLYPIKYHDIFNMVKKHQSTSWVVEELDLSADKKFWKLLSGDEKHFIKYILAFFAASDGIVLENININFSQEIEIPEVRYFYSVQENMENVHSETYSLMIDTYIDDEKEKDYLFKAVNNIPCIKQKADWVQKWMNPKKDSLAKRLLAFSIVEGVFFSGSFSAIDWFGNQNKLVNGLITSNDWISRDEGLHTDFAVLLYTKYIKNKLTQKEVEIIFKEAVDIEINFITVAIPCDMLGMNKTLMSDYIKFVADRLLNSLGYKKIYNTKNPFPFMEKRNLTNKTNFFENRVTEYNKTNTKDNFVDCNF